MKHNIKITIILLAMFIIAQLIGLGVVNFYIQEGNKIPYGFDQKEQIEQIPNFYTQFLLSLVISFAIAVLIILFLVKIKSVWLMKLWFFVVITIALGITINAFLSSSIKSLGYISIMSLAIALILAYFKIFRRNIIIHNITELLIYPGIAAIFVIMLNLTTTIILLILISVYDIWAVWKSKIMMKMASFQINNLGVFGGFLIPYASKKMKQKIKLLKLKYKEKIPEKIIRRNKLKVGIAILGGGDIVFTAISAGVAMKTFLSVYSGLLVILFATLALLYLFIFGKKHKPYPAMPYLTIGIYLGILASWLASLA
jgi:presenilin-like A22 family membrane protease